MNFQKFFALTGMIVFSLVCFSNLYNLIIFWQDIIFTSKISGCAMIFFYMVLVFVFYKQYEATKLVPQLSQEDIDKLMND